MIIGIAVAAFVVLPVLAFIAMIFVYAMLHRPPHPEGAKAAPTVSAAASAER